MSRLILRAFCNNLVRVKPSPVIKNVQSGRYFSGVSRISLGKNIFLNNSYKVVSSTFFNRFQPLHTSGDADLAEYLKDEIKLEKEHDKAVGKKVRGFEVSKSDGPNVVLTKKLDNETITVKFNVNNTIEDSLLSSDQQQQQSQQQEQDDVAMVSKPAFVVEIDKGSDQILAIHCAFPSHEDLPSEQGANHEEAYEDLLEIQDVALLKKSQEWTDDVYSLSGSVMDGNLYDMLLKMLEERGVDADFLDDLVDWSTAYEHTNYINLLEGIQSIVKTK